MNSFSYIKDQLKSSVTVRQVASRYMGVDVGRSNVCCPFHGEKKPSMSVLDDFYYCHSCGATGDAIAFVMNFNNESFKDAVVTIDNDFGLGLTGKRISVARQVAARKRKKEAEEKKHKEVVDSAEYDDICQEYRICELVLNKGIYEPMSDEWCYYTELKNNLEEKMQLGGYL